MDFQLAIKQFEAANGRQAAIDKATNAFKAAYFKTHGKNPDVNEINDYINGILPQTEEEQP